MMEFPKVINLLRCGLYEVDGTAATMKQWRTHLGGSNMLFPFIKFSTVCSLTLISAEKTTVELGRPVAKQKG